MKHDESFSNGLMYPTDRSGDNDEEGYGKVKAYAEEMLIRERRCHYIMKVTVFLKGWRATIK